MIILKTLTLPEKRTNKVHVYNVKKIIFKFETVFKILLLLLCNLLLFENINEFLRVCITNFTYIQFTYSFTYIDSQLQQNVIKFSYNDCVKFLKKIFSVISKWILDKLYIYVASFFKVLDRRIRKGKFYM